MKQLPPKSDVSRYRTSAICDKLEDLWHSVSKLIGEDYATSEVALGPFRQRVRDAHPENPFT